MVSDPHPAPPFVVVAMMGLPGCGKTTLARAVQAATGLSIVDRDAIRAAMFEAHVQNVDEKSAAKAALWLALRALLEGGRGALLDGMPFSHAADRRTAQGLAQAFGAGYLQVHLRLSQRAAIERIRRQPHTSKERNAATVRRVAARFAPLEPGTLDLDARTETAAQCATVVEALSAAVPTRRPPAAPTSG